MVVLMESITALLASFWELFTTLRVPLLDISFAELYLGVFVVVLGLRLLYPIFGVAGTASRLVRRENARSERMRSRSDIKRSHKTGGVKNG